MSALTGKGAALDQFNAQLRANPEYRGFLQSIGVNPDAPVKMSGAQRSAAEAWVRAKHPGIGGSLQIDPAGNVNTDHGVSTAWSNPYFRYPLIAGAALGTAGAAGLLGGAGSAAGAGGSLGGAYGAPAAIASQGVSAGVGAGAGTVATGAGMAGAGGGFWPGLGKFFGSPGGAVATQVGGGLLGNWMQNRALNRGADLQSQYNTDALNYLKEQDARDFAEYLKERDRNWRYEDEDRGRRIRFEDEREGRLAPFRQGAERGYQTLSGLLYDGNQTLPQAMPVGDTKRRSLADLLRA